MRRMKYIVFDMPTIGESIILFPEYCIHADMADALKYVLGKAIRAGFAMYNNGSFCCWGESTTLKLQSDPSVDSKLLQRSINYNYQG